MNHVIQALAAVVIAATATTANAQFVKGNEAVRILPDGSRKVETPPPPSASLGPVCRADKIGCTGSGWRMVETADGIQECTEFYARPGSCRPSTYGAEKRARIWVVKLNGQWKQCVLPDTKSKCARLNELPPVGIVQ